MTPIPLEVCLNRQVLRAIHLELAADPTLTSNLLEHYYPPVQALETQRRIFSTLEPQSRYSRAWAIIGPYGAGKSFFALFLTHALRERGYYPVLLTGSPAPLGRELARALAMSASAFPAVADELISLAKTNATDIPRLMQIVANLQDAITAAHGTGLLIVIDELGKFLEYEAHHPEIHDIHLLQLLAERAIHPHAAPLQLVVLLHQAFEHYQNGLSRTLRQEWQKIQGRFEAIPFIHSSTQIFSLIVQTLKHNGDPKSIASLVATAQESAQILASVNALPAGFSAATAVDLFLDAWPLHPVTLLILPVLCQKMAQNERTLFNFLGSGEAYALPAQLTTLNINDPASSWIMPWQLYDYFIAHPPTDFSAQRRRAEVVSAIERLGSTAAGNDRRLLQTIGLLNLIGAHGGLKASPMVLQLCQPQNATALTTLTDCSLVTFRRFSGEYRVWAGSDFDLATTLQDEIQRLGQFSVADTLNGLDLLVPQVARRHSIVSGTLRFFVPEFVDGPNGLRLYLRANGADLHADVSQEQLRELLAEVLALRRLPEAYQVLTHDPVALHEYREHLGWTEQRLQTALRQLLEQPQRLRWFDAHGEPLTVTNRLELQAILSQQMDTHFAAAPRILNELINRDYPSSSAASGRNKLFAAMLAHPHAEDLGMSGFPAEKGIYRALFRASGLHRPDDTGQWRFAPPPANDPLGFTPLWNTLDRLLVTHADQPYPVTALWQILQAPPLGLRLGPLPLLLVAYLLAHPRETALYEDDQLISRIGYENLELLALRPEHFAVERYPLQGGRLAVFGEYLNALVDPIPAAPTLLDIVRPLARLLAGLPEYARHTKKLSPTALTVREVLTTARRPAALLFQALPEACGLPNPFSLEEASPELIRQYLERLGAALRELLAAYPTLLREIETHLRVALQLVTVDVGLPSLRNALRNRLAGLSAHVGIHARDLLAFLNRLTLERDGDIAWLESVATLLGRIPPTQWRDGHLAEVLSRLHELAQRIHDLARLQVVIKDRPAQAAGRTLLVRTLSADHGEGIAQVVHIENPQALEPLVEQLRPTLDQIVASNPEMRLALLARCFELLTSNYVEEHS